MECGCIKKRDFNVELSYKGCEYLVLEDASIWSGDIPETYEIELQIPSRNKTINLELKTGVKNTFTTVDLFNTSNLQCLPDDIYCITTESCGYSLKINRAFLCNSEIRVNELIYKYALDLDKDKRQLLLDFKTKLDSIKINAKLGNSEISKKLYKLLSDKLKEHHCDNC